MAGQQTGGGLFGEGQDVLELLPGGVSGGLGGGGGDGGEEEGVEGLTQQLLAERTGHGVQRESCENENIMCDTEHSDNDVKHMLLQATPPHQQVPGRDETRGEPPLPTCH